MNRADATHGWRGTTRQRRVLAMLSILAVAATAGLASASPAPAASAPPGFYGVAPATALTPDDFARLARANVRTVRIIFHWPAIAAGPGRFNWLNVDGSVIHAATHGITLIPELSGSPGFISDQPTHPPLDSSSDRELWRQFVAGAVERYGPGGEFWDFVRRCPPEPGHCRPDIPYRPLSVWQVWGEANLGPAWHPRPSADEYADLLSLTSDTIHSVDPGAEVITGGIVGSDRGKSGAIPQNDFIAGLYRNGVADDFDGLSLHPYARKPKQVRRRIQRARAITQVYGDGSVPLWLTELGWSSKGPKDNKQVTSKKGQAKRLKRTMKRLAALREPLNIRLASWFTYLDGSTLCDWCRGAGLFKRNGKPKPAWKKYVRVTGGRR